MFYEAAGWERPHWYESNAPLLEEYGDRVTRREAEWDARWWSPIINAEHLAMRDRAGYTDLTAFAIFDVTGPGALDAVQRVAMRQMDVAVGRVVYTPILMPAGGFKADLTIMRIADDVFRVVTGGGWGMSDLKWFKDHLPADGSAQIHDQTNAWTTLGLWGPRARDILVQRDQRRRLPRGLPVRALEVDRGRTAGGHRLADLLRRRSRLGAVRADRAGRPAVGHHRRGRRARTAPSRSAPACTAPPAGWRSATGPTAPSSRASTTWSRPGWRGARSRTRTSSARRRTSASASHEPAAHMCTLTVDDHTSQSGVKRYMLGGEPILTPDGEPITDAKGRRSYVTSAGAGPSIGKHILMSYLPPEHAQEGEKLLVQYMGERYPVTVAVAGSTPIFDPDNSRIRT